MRLLFVSDIHGNAGALRRFFRATERHAHLGYDEVHCLGDIVGYYGDPYKAWKLVQDRILNVGGRLQTGNHDVLLARWDMQNNRQSGDPADTAAMSIGLHRGRLRQEMSATDYADLIELLSDDDLQYPYEDTRHAYHMIYVHGQPHGHNVDNHGLMAAYLRPGNKDLLELRRALTYAANRADSVGKPVIVVYGHTHLPTLVYLQANGRIAFLGAKYTTSEADHPVNLNELLQRKGDAAVRAIAINGGSIGQPRDGVGEVDAGHVHAHGLLVDTESGHVRFIAVPYVYTGVLQRLHQMRPSVDLNEQDLQVLTHYLAQYYHPGRLPLSTSPQFLADLEINSPEALLDHIQSPVLDWPMLAQAYDAIWQHQIVHSLFNRLSYPDGQVSRGKFYYDYTASGFVRTDRVPC